MQESSSDSHPPKKKSKAQASDAGPARKSKAQLRREAKAAERAALIEAQHESGVMNGTEARRLAKKLGVDVPSLHVETATYIPNSSETEILAGVPAPNARNFTLLTDAEKSHIVGAVGDGLNREAAVRFYKLSYERFRLTLINDKQFHQDIIVAENSRVGNCQALLYADALDETSTSRLSSAQRFIQLTHQSSDRTFNRKLQLKELGMKKAVLDRQLGSIDAPARPDFSCLNKSEFDEYTSLMDLIESGAALDDAQTLALGRYQLKIMRASMAPPPALVASAMNNTIVPIKKVSTRDE